MIQLPRVTMLALDGVGNKTSEYVEILERTMRGIGFGEVVLITADKEFTSTKNIDVHHIEPMDYIDFNVFLCTQSCCYVNTDHMLYIQEDGYVLNPKAWKDEYSEYDYIGTPWIDDEGTPLNFTMNDPDQLVGGGGFSFRSKRFLELASQLPYDREISSLVNEDVFLCTRNFARSWMEERGMVYAPLEISKSFGLGSPHLLREGYIEKEELFGFHGYEALEEYSL